MAGPVPRAFAAFERATAAITRLFVVLACALTMMIVGVILYDVAMREFGTPPVWAHDVARYSMLYLFFFALGPALDSGHHVAVDMFDRLLPRPLRAAQPYAAAALALAFGAVLFWQLLRMTAQAFDDGRLAQATIAVPLKWIYIVGPVGAAHFMMVALVQLGRARWRPAAARPATEGGH